MPKKTDVEALQKRYQRLKEQLARLGLVQIGSLCTRIDRRRDAQGNWREYGPYYQWTFKQAGKTKTVNLSPQQAPLWRKAIANQRLLETLSRQMREISAKILQTTTQGVPKRTRKPHLQD